ncbi:MAG: hypothetical protein V8R49_07800 [Duodenibacillus massiliensis]
MPLPSAPKVEGDILARREYGARVKPEDLKKTAKPVKAKAPAAVKAKTAKKGSKSATKTPDAKALKHEKPAKSPRPAAPALKLPGKAAEGAFGPQRGGRGCQPPQKRARCQNRRQTARFCA